MRSRHRLLLSLVVPSTLSAFMALGCANADGVDDDHHGTEGDDSVATTSQALVATDPVSAAVSTSCSTSVVKGLAVQLVKEIECLRPGTMKRIDGRSGVALSTSAAAVPFLQSRTADALFRAQKARGIGIKINSGLRTLPQQVLLYRWFQLGRCGIGLAAVPGTSNHESGIAVDIDDNVGWRSVMEQNDFRWLGAKDPVHFNYAGSGSVALAGLSIRAFQRLWNRNHPEDLLVEDGDYGAKTEARLMKSPVGGFPLGPSSTCGDAGVAPVDAGPITIPAAPDENEPEGAPEDPPAEAPMATENPPAATADAGGCSASPQRGSMDAIACGALALALALVRAKRRRAR
jgi:hypothetical protein